MNDMSKVSWPGWETVQLIGRGSFGAVYKIRRDVLGDVEEAALKVISIPQNAGDIEELYSDGFDEESITSTFQNHLKSIVAEYSLMRKMNGSANVVNCDDIRYVQHDDGIGWDIYIKMELLTPLTKALPADIPEEMVVKIARDLCAALKLCSKHEIIHRDIKPQNIFVSPNGDYKLGDFGIAKTVEKTSGGTKIGTYKYMAPEVYNNQPYGRAADIYSLGLVLYWLLNERRMPFLPLPPAKLGVGMDEQARIRRLSGEPIPAPANGSPELKDIVLKACAYNPKDRYTSPDAMLADLKVLGEDSAAVAAVIPPIAASQPVGAAQQAASPWPNGTAGDDDATVGVFGGSAAAAAASQLSGEEDKVGSAFAGGVAGEDEATVGVFGKTDGLLDGEGTVGVWGAVSKPTVTKVDTGSVPAPKTPMSVSVEEPVTPPSAPVISRATPVQLQSERPANKTKKKSWIPLVGIGVAVAVLAVVLMMVFGGGTGNLGGADVNQGGNNEDAGNARIDNLKVFVFWYDEADFFLSSVRAELNAQLDAAGVTYYNQFASKDQAKQLEQVKTAIADGANLLVVNVVISGAPDIAQSIVDAAGDIPVIFFNRAIGTDGTDVTMLNGNATACFIGTDAPEAGGAQGWMIGYYVLANYDEIDLNGDGVITYAMFKGEEGNVEAIYRTQFSVEAADWALTAAGKPALVYFDAQATQKWQTDPQGAWSAKAAKEYMDTNLVTYRESNGNMIELVICNNDGMAEGAIASLQQAGYNVPGAHVVPVFGIDCTNAAQALIAAGAMTGTIRQDANGMAVAISETIKAIAAGKTPVEALDSLTDERLSVAPDCAGKLYVAYAPYTGY